MLLLKSRARLKSISLLFLIFVLHAPACKNQAGNNASDILSDPPSFEGKVVGIKDGDTFIVLDGTAQVTVRLSDIDCPEKNQPFGTRAKQAASDLCFGKPVTVVRKARNDRYGRLIGEVFVDKISVNKEMVRQGLAWQFTRYSKDPVYKQLEQSARDRKVGIWSEKSPTPPWMWRKKRQTPV
ncbi:MAG: thermonuclease family protein [Chitinophagaceae bacterium]|nr:MAG: thermonuclease family protein [Chitinophagaceae bacterium]